MLRPLCRVDLSNDARDFQPVALQPGFPLLDKANANSKVLQQWLGRLAAEPRWEQSTVLFYARNEGGTIDEDIKARLATSADLHGTLASELDLIRQKLSVVKPRGPKAVVLHQAVTRQFQDDVRRAEIDDPRGCFFKYKDAQGKQRLSWCWGIRHKNQDAGRAVVCATPQCNQLAVLRDDVSKTCVRCNASLAGRFTLAKLTVVAAVLVMLGLITFGLLKSGFLSPAETTEQVAQVERQAARSDKTESVPDGPSVVPEERISTRDAVTPAVSEPMRSTGTAASDPKVVMPASPATESAATSSLSGQVVDSLSNVGIAGATITLSGVDNAMTTDAEGRFLVPDVSPGRMTLDVAASGYAARHLTELVRPGKTHAVDITLKGTFVLDGLVIDAKTKMPVSNAQVSTTPASLVVKTDSAGQFRIEALRNAPVKLLVAASGYGAHESDHDPKLKPGPVRIELLGNAVLTGQVLDAVKDAPIPNASVSVAALPQSVVTDDAGRFRVDGLRAGPTRFSVAADGYDTQQTHEELKPDTETAVEVKLTGKMVPTPTVVKKAAEPTIVEPVPKKEVPKNEVPEMEVADDAEHEEEPAETDAAWEDMLAGLRSNGLDVVWIFDSTSSMGGVLNQVKSRVREITNTVHRLVPNARFSVWTYRDFGDAYVVQGIPLTNNVDALERFLSMIRADGGGDGPEAVEEGLISAICQSGFQPRSRKVILIVGDAPPHEGDVLACRKLAESFHTAHDGVISTIACSALSMLPIAELADDSVGAALAKEVEALAGSALTSGTILPAFGEIAKSGHGESHSIRDHKSIVAELLVLAFGSRYRQNVLNALKATDSVSIASAASDDDHASRDAAKPLVEIKAGKSNQSLERLFQDRQSEARRWALGTARRMQRPFARQFVAALTDPDEANRQEARLALIQLADGADYGPLPGATEEEQAKSIQDWKEWLAEWIKKHPTPTGTDRPKDATGPSPMAKSGSGAAGSGKPRQRRSTTAGSGRTRTTPGSRPPTEKPESRPLTLEERAQYQLSLANQALNEFRKQAEEDPTKGGQLDSASREVLRKRFQGIIDKFPGTKAATTAKRTMDTFGLRH